MITVKPECLRQTKGVAQSFKKLGFHIVNVFPNLGTIIGVCDEKDERLRTEEVQRLSFMDCASMYGQDDIKHEWQP